jgi:hypothetical protein
MPPGYGMSVRLVFRRPFPQCVQRVFDMLVRLQVCIGMPTVLRTTIPPILPPFGRSAVADYAVLTRLDAASVHSCLPFVVSLLQRTDEARPRGRRAKRGSPLRGLRCESSATFSSCAAAALSGERIIQYRRSGHLGAAPCPDCLVDIHLQNRLRSWTTHKRLDLNHRILYVFCFPL